MTVTADIDELRAQFPESTERLDAAIERGIAWLDAHMDRWWERVDVCALEMESGCYCVLGQIYADRMPEGWTYGKLDFSTGTPFLWAVEEFNIDAEDLGFDQIPELDEDDLMHDHEQYDYLYARWTDELEKRDA